MPNSAKKPGFPCIRMLTVGVVMAILASASPTRLTQIRTTTTEPKFLTRTFQMARKKKKSTARKAPARKAAKRGKSAKRRSAKKTLDMIISKSRTKAAAGINVSGDFYTALDGAVRELISSAERRALDNGRKTLRPHDL